MKKATEKHTIKQIVKNNLFLLKICFEAAPLYVVLYITEIIRNEATIFVEFTLAFNYVLESLEFGRPFSEVLVFFIGVFSFVALGLLFNANLYHRLQFKAMPRINKKLKDMLYMKAREIDLSCYDDPEYYNNFILAVAEAENQIERIFQLISSLLTSLTAIVTSGLYFLKYDAVSVLFILASFISSFFVSNAINKLNYSIRMKKNPILRKLGYINRVFYLNDYAKEIRLNTEAANVLLENFDETNDTIIDIDKKAAPHRFWLSFLKNYICNDFVTDVLYISYLIFSAAVLRTISYSNVAVMRGTANRLKGRMRMLSEVYPFAMETSLYVEKINDFLNLEPKIISLKNRHVPNEPALIELRNVSFGYNEKEGYVLKNINMKLDPCSKSAIVGYNGAGKTTLIKIIMRLYDVDEGEVLLNGINIKEYNIEEYQRYIGTIFQDYKIYAATVKENVLLNFENSADDASVFEAIEKSGFSGRLKTLDKGLAANLTREFEEDGVDLSGGEGQKIAIARVFHSDSGLMVLDEPSSALDPIAEYHLNHSILDMARSKSVIFISHRLSTTRKADKIYMLENGRIIEEGCHEELLALGGKYAQMWRAQAGQYHSSDQRLAI